MSRVTGRSPRSFSQVLRGAFQDALAVGAVSLIMLGVGGLVYKLLSPDGWLTGWLGRIWDRSPGMLWLVAFVGAVAVIMGKHLYDRNPGGTPGNSLRGNFVVYGFLALGLFFFFKLLVTGSL